METNPPIRRKLMRAESWDYSHEGSYFVTTVTHRRAQLFGEITNGAIQLSPAGKEVERYWLELESKYPQVLIGEYVVMPNHVHGILRVLPKNVLEHFPETLGDMMKWFKSMSTNAYIRGVKAEGWPRFEGKLWQPGYWDHIVRNDDDLDRIREYIANNPFAWQEDPDNPASDEAWQLKP